jgi:putative acetyltransferase
MSAGAAVVPIPAPALRLARAADVPDLAALYAHSASQLGPQIYSAQQVQAWQGFGRDTPAFRDYVLHATTWLAEDALGPLGFCGIGADGEVHSLYVRADATRQGLGSALLAHAMAQARGQGMQQFSAWATPFSLPVFGRAGFVLVHTVRAPYQGAMFERFRVALA